MGYFRNNKIWFVLIGLVLVISAGILFFWLSGEPVSPGETSGVPEEATLREKGQEPENKTETEDIDHGDEIDAIRKRFHSEPDPNKREAGINSALYKTGTERLRDEYCLSISQAELRDRCLHQLAVRAYDPDKCEMLGSQEARDACLKSVVMSAAREKGEIQGCALLSQEKDKKACVDSVLKYENSREVCGRLASQALSDYCLDKSIFFQAQKENSVSLCREINDLGERIWCLAFVEGVGTYSDNDEDGLLFYEEVYYNTDYNNPDSDGDGFIDGDEVLESYNPAGTGVLTKFYWSNPDSGQGEN